MARGSCPCHARVCKPIEVEEKLTNGSLAAHGVDDRLHLWDDLRDVSDSLLAGLRLRPGLVLNESSEAKRSLDS